MIIFRRNYLKELSDYTGRNVIAYYSSWLSRQGQPNLDINDSDMTGFMNCIHGLDCTKGLDLILHTPGGSPAAAEAIVNYLRSKFNNDIRVIVPQLAMSAGTMIACSAKVIIMGKQSSLGPIDPQFNGIPAYNIMMEFEEARVRESKIKRYTYVVEGSQKHFGSLVESSTHYYKFYDDGYESFSTYPVTWETDHFKSGYDKIAYQAYANGGDQEYFLNYVVGGSKIRSLF